MRVMRAIRRPTVASRALAEQLRPVIRAHGAVRRLGHELIDVAHARMRMASGRRAFDPEDVLEHVHGSELADAFAEVASAMELAGMATARDSAAIAERRTDVRGLLLAWVTAEAPPVAPGSRAGRRIAWIVGNAILSGVSAPIMEGLARVPRARPRCPCCGAGPDLAYTTEVRRYLICWRCDATWRVEDRGCLGCGADTPPTLVRIPSPLLGYELAICNSCGRYLKERRGGLIHEAIVERALTAGLDDAARQRGLRL